MVVYEVPRVNGFRVAIGLVALIFMVTSEVVGGWVCIRRDGGIGFGRRIHLLPDGSGCVSVIWIDAVVGDEFRGEE